MFRALGSHLYSYFFSIRDNTIAWQPNTQQQQQQQQHQQHHQQQQQQQQTNVSVTVSSVWGVSSAPSLVNPGGLPMQAGGMNQQFDQTAAHNNMKPMNNQQGRLFSN